MKMPSWCVLFAMLLGLFLATGCGSTLTQSAEARAISWRQNIETDMKTLPQDVDMWMMMDRPTRLSKARTN